MPTFYYQHEKNKIYVFGLAKRLPIRINNKDVKLIST